MDIISPIEVPDREASVVGLWKVGAAADAYLARRSSASASPDTESPVRFIPHTPDDLARRAARLAARQTDGKAPPVYRFRRPQANTPPIPPSLTHDESPRQPDPELPPVPESASQTSSSMDVSPLRDGVRSRRARVSPPQRMPAPSPAGAPGRGPRLRSDWQNLDAVILHWLRRNHIVP